MAQPTTIKGQSITVLYGDGATPTEVFTIFCGLTTKSLSEQVNTSDTFIDDCADPDAIALRVIDIQGYQWEISGEGLFNLDQRAALDTMLGLSKNFRFKLGTAGYYQAKGVLSSKSITGTRGERTTANITIQSDGSKLA